MKITPRKDTQYLSSLRSLTILLVVVYHVFYLFNTLGVLGSLPHTQPVPGEKFLLPFVYPWFMVLLFVISGTCACYALEKTSNRSWLKSRAVKLLVPSTAGLFVFQWITGWLNIYYGGGLDYIPSFLLYPIAVLSGTGPLWFIQELFLFCLLLALLRKWRKEPFEWPEGIQGALLLFGLGVLLWLSSCVLNMPVITVYRFGIYAFAFLVGYYVFPTAGVQSLLKTYAFWYGLAAAALGVFYLMQVWGANYTESAVLESWYTNLYAWAMVLTLLGLGARYLNRQTPFLAFLERESYGIYILHYPIMMLLCSFMAYQLHIQGLLCFVIAVPLILVLAVGLNWILSRIPVLRTLILGLPWKSKTA